MRLTFEPGGFHVGADRGGVRGAVPLPRGHLSNTKYLRIDFRKLTLPQNRQSNVLIRNSRQ